MSIITHICPHCATDHIGLRIVAATTISSEDWIAHMQCPKCLLPSAARMNRDSSGNKGSWELWKQQYDMRDLGWAVFGFWPETPKPLIPENLPPDVERIYLQAERNFPTAGNEEAAGIMYGKALDIGLKKIDPTLTGMLGQKIKKLSNTGKLTSDMVEWSGQIRDIRNDATHEEIPISRDELIDLRNFSEMVLRYLSTGYIPVDGIGTIMTQWTNLKDFNGEIGKLFKEKLKKDKNATWYILNFSLFALNNQSDMEVIMDAASSEDRNINIEWNFQTPEFVLNNYYSKLILYYLLPDII